MFDAIHKMCEFNKIFMDVCIYFSKIFEFENVFNTIRSKS